MAIPGFTAERSIGPGAGVYHGSSRFGGADIARGLSLQSFSGLRFPGLEFRCCGWVCIPGGHCYYYCRTCFQRPGYHCQCIPGFPACTCRPLELAPF